MDKKTVLCAMSGGVDSSVAAALLLQQGYQVIGATMQIWGAEEGERACCSLSAVEDARRVAAKLGIPHYVLNFQEEFRQTVIEDFIREYRCGHTPNPCIQCNRWLKFDKLLRCAHDLGARFIATGHYARTFQDTGRFAIRRGIDRSKDQSYALYSLEQEQLENILFPLGELTKVRVREIGRELGLRTADKPDSQEICFVPDNDYGRFLREEAPDTAREGDILDLDGKVVGRHGGIAFYTIGQRKGLGLYRPHPLYVVALDSEKNTLTVGEKSALFQQRATTRNLVLGKWDEEALNHPRAVTAMLRYKMVAAPGIARLEGGNLILDFDLPQRAVTPGQALVCYDGDDVVCGGTIAS
ncbi:MAG TPA: tRNA 2-thiouridine(34) synthase MnmA [Cyanobacteria bacterium UBA8530]|nr:tRNA 2-thiouridine(34) synthase MnmA [Cyanobacteria bacterium UBA8530]